MMRFAGHETFAVREGWLHKGLKLLIEDPQMFGDPDEADRLGVGKNMARSIRHWLVATELAEPKPGSRAGRRQPLAVAEFGRLIWDRDRYFAELGTWWALHVNLVQSPTRAAAWHWFFNGFGLDRFERSVCLESLKRHVQLSRLRMPSPRTLERDVACLLSSYARIIPATEDDPEDGRDCPFRELGLLTHFKTSGYYQLNQLTKEIPPEILGYALAKAFREVREGDAFTEILLQRAARESGSPGRVFVLTAESLFDTASRVEHLSQGDLEIAGLAGQRSIRVRQRSTLDWLREYYNNIKVGDRHAA